ncbi:MAG: helix-turn-helix transcriptional regulator [Ekhidna sp.]|nr:helix-turn-helix transcriptional regulator [Ekhidna sp.]
MALADNIKYIREEKSFLQKDVAEHIGVDKSTYSKIEKGTRELTVKELQKVAELFNLSIDQIVSFEGSIPKEITIEDKSSIEQMRLIQQLDDEDKQTIFKLIDKMLTNKKFKDFFNKNVAAL